MANKAVVDAQNNVNAKQKALADAQQALKELQDQVAQDQASGAAGFFKAIADNKDNSESLREDAQTAYEIVAGTYNGEYGKEPTWYAERVHLGAKNDATSIEEMKNVLPYLPKVNEARTSHNRSVLGISLTDMAVAMIDADYQTGWLEHPDSLYQSENLTTYMQEPVQSWMQEEETWNEMVKEHPEYADVLNSSYNIYAFFANHYNEYLQVGHFLNLMDPELTHFGMGRLDDSAVSWDVNDVLDVSNPLSVEAYTDLFNKYSKDVLKEDQLNTLKANVATANQNLIAAQNAVKSAQNNVQSLQANLAELKNGSTKINKAISDTQAALAKGQENLKFEQKQLDQANQTLADVQAKVGTKAKALEDAKAAQAKAAEAVAQAQNVLSEATAAVKASQAKVDAAQNDVQAKDNNLKSVQAALDSLNQTLNNLENAQSNLSAAQTALNKANDDVTAANKAVKAQQLILDTLKESKSKADAQVTNASEELKKAEAELAAEQSKLKDAKARLDAFNKKETENSHKETSNAENPVKPTNKPDTSHVVKPSDKADEGSTVKPTEKTDSNGKASTTNSSETTTTTPEPDVKDSDTVEGNVKSDLKTDNKSEEKSSTVKIVDNSDSSAVSVVLTGSNTPVKTFGEKTVNGTTYYKVSANRWVKADKAHVVAVTGTVTTNKLPQTGAKNELIAALSGLAVAGTILVSYLGINRKKKNN